MPATTRGTRGLKGGLAISTKFGSSWELLNAAANDSFVSMADSLILEDQRKWKKAS